VCVCVRAQKICILRNISPSLAAGLQVNSYHVPIIKSMKKNHRYDRTTEVHKETTRAEQLLLTDASSTDRALLFQIPTRVSEPDDRVHLLLYLVQCGLKAHYIIS
jgi:hypothetical protein